MFEQHFFIDSRFMGSVVRPAMIVHAERQPPYSVAYFCPHCGEVWARAVTTNGNGQVQKWEIGGGHCRLHPGPSPYTVPGSLLLAWEPEYNALLLSCPDVVKWEFDRHMEFIERRIAND